jgi:hypothetical protein
VTVCGTSALAESVLVGWIYLSPTEALSIPLLGASVKIHTTNRRGGKPRGQSTHAPVHRGTWALLGQREYCRSVLIRWLQAEQEEAAAQQTESSPRKVEEIPS